MQVAFGTGHEGSHSYYLFYYSSNTDNCIQVLFLLQIKLKNQLQFEQVETLPSPGRARLRTGMKGNEMLIYPDAYFKPVF